MLTLFNMYAMYRNKYRFIQMYSSPEMYPIHSSAQVSPRHTWIQLQHVTDSLKSPGTAHDSIIIQQDEP